jgi:hypothetical protein
MSKNTGQLDGFKIGTELGLMEQERVFIDFRHKI